MSISKIPIHEPVAPPQPEQLGLYDAGEWESAYRDLHRVPLLLIQLQDDLARSRRREAIWISLLTHLIVIFILFNWEKLNLSRFLPWHSVVALAPTDVTKGKSVTFLELPPDAQKLLHKPDTDKISDKNRIATSRHPELDPRQLRKLLSPPPGAQAPSVSPAPSALAQNQPPAPQPQSQPQDAPRAPSDPAQLARLQTPAHPKSAEVFKSGPVSAGSAIQQAARAAAGSRGTTGVEGGDFGLGQGQRGRQLGALDVLSDTQGVNFGPYLARIVHDVRENWYRIIPESASMKKGQLGIEFAILKDGSVASMKLVSSSGDVALDRAAWGGITASNPFPPLPNDFGGKFLALRFRFYYNPEKEDIQ